MKLFITKGHFGLSETSLSSSLTDKFFLTLSFHQHFSFSLVFESLKVIYCRLMLYSLDTKFEKTYVTKTFVDTHNHCALF